MENNKNLWVIPTDKPSRLHLAYNMDFYISIEPFIQLDIKNYKSFNLYITSDEEIKEGDWFLHPFNTLHKAGGNLIDKDFRKIILTTDQSLDGVQAIDDDFLEWFVKNPSCEEVEVEKDKIFTNYNNPLDLLGRVYIIYKIIIPKEETKQDLEEVECNMCGNIMSLLEDKSNYACFNKECTRCYKEYEKESKQESKQETIKISCVQCCGTGEIQKSTNRKQSNFECDLCNGRGHWNKIIEPKQETLEEAFNKYSECLEDFENKNTYEHGFIDGAKWQQERSYSEEEVYNMIIDLLKRKQVGLIINYGEIEEWFKQFKNK